MRVTPIIALLACSLLIGCDPVAKERVVLTLPSTNESASVKSAVSEIDAILVDQGFTPTHNTNSEVVAIYDRGAGNLGCLVSHRTGEVEVLFTDIGRFQSRPETIKARDAIREKLRTSFGKDKVSQ
jgi:hypothetical protein